MRRLTLLTALWCVASAGVFFAVTAEPGAPAVGLAWLAVAAMVVGIAFIARAELAVVTATRSAVAIAAGYTAAVFAAWHLGGQGSVELLVGAIAILDLALVGLSLVELGAIALAMAGIYATIS